jgi:hypothetical protein
MKRMTIKAPIYHCDSMIKESLIITLATRITEPAEVAKIFLGSSEPQSTSSLVTNRSQLAYWIVHDFKIYPIVNSLTNLSSGLYPLEETEPNPAGV